MRNLKEAMALVGERMERADQDHEEARAAIGHERPGEANAFALLALDNRLAILADVMIVALADEIEK